MKRLVVTVALVVPLALASASPAGACGGLVGENGTIQLVRTTTLAAYSDGVERYMTGFEFTGEGEEVGSLVPLSGVPTEVTKGGDWTLQRLQQEVQPPVPEAAAEASTAADGAGGAEVILETEIDALDITVLRGGGDEVGEWADDNGFLLPPDAPEVLDFYAQRSPIFMAARFDADRAADLGQGAGDSTPIMATIPTDRPWVPLRILGLGLDAQVNVEADVFMLTDDEPQLMAGGPGVDVVRSEQASDLLLDDLRSDERMEWVPEEAWLSYLQVNTPAGELDFDLAASVDPDEQPSLVDAGIDRVQAVPVALGGDRPIWPIAVGTGAAVALVVILGRRFFGHQGPVPS
jgi:hypothetical protein